MLQRDDFSKRYTEGHPISVMELLYPLLQGWDSVMVEADVELGGSDQLWNFLVARDLQEQEGQEAQVVLTMPLLVGLDGAQKMSKSLGNYVGIAEVPGEQFGKLMSVPDAVMKQYFELATVWPLEQAQEVEHAVEQGDMKAVEAKRLLARTVVDLYHGAGMGAEAEAEFDRVFVARDVPDDVPDVTVPADEVRDGVVRVATLLAHAFPQAVSSNKEGRRKIQQGGVRLDGDVVTDADAALAPVEIDGKLLQLGKRNWARLVPEPVSGHARHVHRTAVVFADGTSVAGVTFLGDDPYRRDAAPAFGLYLDPAWAPPWPHARRRLGGLRRARSRRAPIVARRAAGARPRRRRRRGRLPRGTRPHRHRGRVPRGAHGHAAR